MNRVPPFATATAAQSNGITDAAHRAPCRTDTASNLAAHLDIGFPRHAFRRRRDISSLLLRTFIIILLILALAGLQNVQAVDRLAVVFLVDDSDSMGSETEDRQLEFIRSAIAEKQPDDEWAALLFGDNAVPETDFSQVGEIENFSATARRRPAPISPTPFRRRSRCSRLTPRAASSSQRRPSHARRRHRAGAAGRRFRRRNQLRPAIPRSRA